MGMDIENQVSEGTLGPEKNRKRDVRDWQREDRGFRHNAPGESSVLRRGDIPVIHGDCDGKRGRKISQRFLTTHLFMQMWWLAPYPSCWLWLSSYAKRLDSNGTRSPTWDSWLRTALGVRSTQPRCGTLVYRITRAIQVGSQLLSTAVISDHEVEEERSELEKGSFNSNNIFNSLIGFFCRCFLLRHRDWHEMWPLSTWLCGRRTTL